MASSVHPRGRGEHLGTEIAQLLVRGSSPRARGTPRSAGFRSATGRFIPAGAGNTCQTKFGFQPGTVHPRGRGEHPRLFGSSPSSAGSSPRARGTLGHGTLDALQRRFIPAGAGNTTVKHAARSSTAVHPRGRGEHGRMTVGPRQKPGSSPRARGTRVGGCQGAGGGRFIPAGAGNTRTRHARRAPTPVHPRGRGEHAAARVSPPAAPGSSPRARGTRHTECSNIRIRRFIPAGAGNTSRSRCGGCSRPVHPRGRGEHDLKPDVDDSPLGSSPRARGTLTESALMAPSLRFIPAGAGNTRIVGTMTVFGSVHPRGRGEHMCPAHNGHWLHGSSPRARGTRLDRVRRPGADRFIPAGAGNT